MRRAVVFALLGCTAAACSLAVPTGALAAPGALDGGFGSGGTVLTPFGSNSFARASAIALTSDGKLVAGGRADADPGPSFDERFGLARYQTNGALDPSFGAGGTVLALMGSDRDDRLSALVVEPDGKLVAAGQASTGNVKHLAIARFNPNGSLDPSFGSGGVTLTVLGDGGFSRAEALVRQPDGKLVTAGADGVRVALARYHSNGTLDQSFGSNGVVLNKLPSAGYAKALALQADGKLVAAGTGSSPDGVFMFALLRYNPDGSLDLSFGSGGTVLTPVGAGGFAQASSIALQPDGKIVVAGEARDGGSRFALARYLPNGALDLTFGSGGTVVNGIGSASEAKASGLIVQPDGKLLAAGSAGTYSTASCECRFALARYLSDGTLDPGFGARGSAETPFPGGSALATSLAMQPDGKPVAAGFHDVSPALSDVNQFALARYEESIAPAVSVTVKGGNLAELVKRGVLRLRLRLGEAGRVRLEASTETASNSRKGSRTLRLTRKTLKFNRPLKRTLKLKLKRKQLKKLAKRRRVTVTLVGTARDRIGNESTTRATRAFRR